MGREARGGKDTYIVYIFNVRGAKGMVVLAVLCAFATLISYACCVAAGRADDLAEQQRRNRH